MYRICALKSLFAVMPVVQKEKITEVIVPTLVKATTDAVPNVKFCVTKLLMEKKTMIDQSAYETQIVPKLKEQVQDADKDVAYFATVALQD